MMGRSMRGARLTGAAALLATAGAVHADGDADRGAKRFEECAACHTIDRNASSVGPSLYGVFERQAGQLVDFRYSPALKRSGITWTAQTIDRFIADPQAVVPANRLPYAGLPDAGGRADLIAFLQKTFK